MKIVVTGATGLIGRALMEQMENSSYDVIALSRTRNEGVYKKTDYSIESLENILKNTDVVVHLAAIRGNFKEPKYFNYSENEVLTENILNSMKNNQVKKIIFLSSISVYSDLKLLPWSEKQPVNPVNFYGLSKYVCEQLCKLYEKYGIKSTILRCAHVLGYEKRGYMLDRFMDAAANQEKIFVFGKSIARREFIYVKDVARAIIWAIKNSDVSGVFNLGSKDILTNLDVANVINTVFDNINNLEYKEHEKEGIVDSYMDSSKIYQAGFQNKYDFYRGIQDIYKNFFG